MNKVKRGRLICGIVLMLLCLIGCSTKKEETQGKCYQIYYVNDEQTALVGKEYATLITDEKELIRLIFDLLANPENPVQNKAVIDDHFIVDSFRLEDQILYLDLSPKYKELDIIQQVLKRAAIVRTLCQIEGVNSVNMTVLSEPLTDSFGHVIGPMKAEQFIDNAGREINTVETVKLDLYFANSAGDKLVKRQRIVEYNSNISMEKLVVEQLIAGPESEQEGFAVVNPSCKALGVTVKDRVCYVNFDNAFLTLAGNCLPETTIYAITNSLVELSHIDKVQFSINGDVNISFYEKLNLSVLYERNLDLVQSSAEALSEQLETEKIKGGR